MAANTSPIFTKNGKVASVLITAANTSSQGGGTIATDTFLVLTADATNGTYCDRVRFTATATTPTTTTATVGRVYISSVGTGATTSANTYLWAEITLPAVAADNSAAQAQWFDVPLGFVVPAGFFVLAMNHA